MARYLRQLVDHNVHKLALPVGNPAAERERLWTANRDSPAKNLARTVDGAAGLWTTGFQKFPLSKSLPLAESSKPCLQETHDANTNHVAVEAPIRLP
jgi:hypothetical protein